MCMQKMNQGVFLNGQQKLELGQKPKKEIRNLNKKCKVLQEKKEL